MSRHLTSNSYRTEMRAEKRSLELSLRFIVARYKKLESRELNSLEVLFGSI